MKETPEMNRLVRTRPDPAPFLVSTPLTCLLRALRAFAIFALILLPARADDVTATEPVLERPTLRCLGAYWVASDGVTARVGLEYRRAGESAWRAGPPMFRVENGKHKSEKYGSRLDVPDGSTLFAGSVVDLEPGTAYELRLTLERGGQKVTRTLAARTRAEPVIAADSPVRYVVPDPDRRGGGSGTSADPFRGLSAAQVAARPGDLFVLRGGAYAGEFVVNRFGDEGRPIVWRGEEADKVVLTGKPKDGRRAARVISASNAHDVWFENLTIKDADYGIVAHDAARLVVRGCHITGVDYGLAATRNSKEACVDFFVADNIVEGPSVWPRSKGIENARGVQVTGAGHFVCYNRITNFAAAIDTFDSPRCESIDFYGNDVRQMTDDGMELDYSQRNVRCFDNRFTDVFQGISVQPVYGGPVYAFRNALFNVVAEPFKMHNSPSGAVFYHNTVVKKGPPLLLYTREPASNLVMRNNLFVGTAAGYAWECNPTMTDCDFDSDGFAGGPFKMFLKWNNKRYATFEEMTAEAPIERHATRVEAAGLFASGVVAPEDEKAVHEPVDLRLAEKSNAVGAGQPLPGFDDGFAGRAPDLGAYEAGKPLPHYGPRNSGGR
jgi:hypothetical protein